MRAIKLLALFLAAQAGGNLVFSGAAGAADAPSLEQTLKFRPQHGDVEYDTPEPKTFKQCKVTVVEDKENKRSGWLVTGPAGQPLRKFMDTNGDDVVDQWSYFRNGLEVYRDIDSNFNNKIDQSRWLNLGGTRWGIDKNEDGRIDSWRMISAEEVSRIAVRALVSQDASLLAPLMLTRDDLEELGITGPLEKKLLSAVADAPSKLRKNAANSKIIHARTTWLRFDASPPAIVPAETYKTAGDLFVYENVMAIVDHGKADQPGLVHVGELVRVGDVWKMTSLPTPLEGTSIELAPGAIMFEQQAIGTGATGSEPVAGVSEKVQELVEQLRKLMENPPGAKASKNAFDKYYKEVENVLIGLVNESKTDEERAQWVRQLLDTVAAAVQSGKYPAGVARLKQLEGEIAKSSPKSPLRASAAYRRMLAEYFAAMYSAESDKEAQQKVYENWLKELEDFLDAYPKSEEAPDAALQLAVQLELGGKSDQAKKWYERLTSEYGDAPAAERGQGALRRLELTGKTLNLTGSALEGGGTIDVKQYRGKVLAVYFWDTNSKIALEDLPDLKSLYDEYRGKGFEILGINLDPEKAPVTSYLSQHGIRWPQIHEPGGLESAPARAFGINLLPTMFVVDADGKVLNRNAGVSDLKSVLEDQLAKK